MLTKSELVVREEATLAKAVAEEIKEDKEINIEELFAAAEAEKDGEANDGDNERNS
jgi:hypothetical protein